MYYCKDFSVKYFLGQVAPHWELLSYCKQKKTIEFVSNWQMFVARDQLIHNFKFTYYCLFAKRLAQKQSVSLIMINELAVSHQSNRSSGLFWQDLKKKQDSHNTTTAIHIDKLSSLNLKDTFIIHQSQTKSFKLRGNLTMKVV